MATLHERICTVNPQVNWHRIRDELQRLTDVDKLRSEVHRIGGEIRKFDFHAVLSPKAARKVEKFEKRYADLMERLHLAQRQVDKELGRILEQIKTHRDDVAKSFTQQKEKLEQVSNDFRQRFAKKTKSSGAGRSEPTPTPRARVNKTRRKAAAATTTEVPTAATKSKTTPRPRRKI